MSSHSPFPSLRTPGNTLSALSLLNLPVLGISPNGIIPYVVFCCSLFSLCMMCLRFIHVVAWLSTSFVFIVRICYIWYSQLRSLGCFHLWGILNSAAVSAYVQVSMWTYVLISLVYVPGTKIAGSRAHSALKFLKNYQTLPKRLYCFTF